MGLRAWLRRTSKPTTPVTARRSFRPSLDPLEDRDVPAVVGYYDMAYFQGIDNQIAPITAAGHTPVRLYDLTAADLAGLDVLFVQNLFNDTYGVEYRTRLAPIQAAVEAGLTLVIHDRHVDTAESILPGGAGFNVVRDFTDPNNIQVLDDTTLLTHGPGGTVTNTTLDNGSNSSHGYATAASLPADARKLLTTGDPSHVVTFSYRFGAGNVMYSTIPLDYYLGGQNAFAQVYAPNVVAYAADLHNRPPVASPVMLFTAEDTALGGRLAAADPNGDTLTYAVATQPHHGTVTVTNPATGDFVYTPAPNYFGLDEFTFTASDGRGGAATGTVTVGVTPVNDAPVAANDALSAAEDTAAAIVVQANDADVDGDTLSVTAVTQAAHGVVSIGAGGIVVYTPAANFNGTDSFTYTVTDGHGGASTAAVNVTVGAVNDAPVAPSGLLTVAEDGSVTVDLLANASDVDGDALIVTVTAPAHGTVTLAGGTATYTPAADFNGTDEFTYTVDDGNGGTATGTVTVTVAPVNDTPVAVGATAATDEDTPLTMTLPTTDVDGDALVLAVGAAAHGTVVLNPDGTVTYTPAADYNGTDTFTYTVDDGNGGTATAAVAVAVVPVNDAPTAADVTATAEEDAPVTVSVAALDVDGDALTLTAGPAAHGSVTVNPDGTVTYTPATDFNGTDTFTYTVSDGNGGTASALVTVTVAPANDPPTADAGLDATADERDEVVFSATATDLDGDTLSYQWDFGDGSTGSGPTATHSYLDDGDYTAVLTVTDGRGGVTTDARTVTVRNVAPVVTPGQGATIDEGGTFATTGTFTDPGLDIWAVTVDYGDGSGVRPLVLNSDGTFDLSHAYADDGEYTVTVRVDDGDGGVGTATLTVTARNVAPVADAGADRTATRGAAVTLTGTFTDPGAADVHTQTWSVRDPAGRVVATGTGSSISFVPADGGVYLASFTVTDDDGGSSTDTVRVTVPGSTAPLTLTGPTESQLGRTVTFTAALAVPGPSLIVWVVTDAHGRIVAAAIGGQISFLVATPGPYTVTCLSVSGSGVHTATAQVTAAPPPQLPAVELASRPGGKGNGRKG